MNKHSYKITLSCEHCSEYITDVEVAVTNDTGLLNLTLPVDVESVRLGLIRAIAVHEDDHHSMGQT